MNRKDFLKKGLLGTGMFITSAAVGDALLNVTKPEPQPEPIGFNHLPIIKSKIMENAILHKAATRGHADHGWLESYHTFSFANYHNPDRMNFGVLRVLNDDRVNPGMGFGTHRHDNMEIISIPLEGDLEHKDSMGTSAVIKEGDIQVMSAGSGISHSEYNKNSDKLTKFLQIWVFPKERNVKPRYDQITLDQSKMHNNLLQVLSPNAEDEGVWVHQDAWFHMGKFDKDSTTTYNLKKEGNGVYAFMLEGDFTINGIALNRRDGLGVWNTDALNIEANSADAKILLMEVPMQM
jgi:redox-sensitive bicupin YhaK (pirin superfamily)